VSLKFIFFSFIFAFKGFASGINPCDNFYQYICQEKKGFELVADVRKKQKKFINDAVNEFIKSNKPIRGKMLNEAINNSGNQIIIESYNKDFYIFDGNLRGGLDFISKSNQQSIIESLYKGWHRNTFHNDFDDYYFKIVNLFQDSLVLVGKDLKSKFVFILKNVDENSRIVLLNNYLNFLAIKINSYIWNERLLIDNRFISEINKKYAKLLSDSKKVFYSSYFDFAKEYASLLSPMAPKLEMPKKNEYYFGSDLFSNLFKTKKESSSQEFSFNRSISNLNSFYIPKSNKVKITHFFLAFPNLIQSSIFYHEFGHYFMKNYNQSGKNKVNDCYNCMMQIKDSDGQNVFRFDQFSEFFADQIVSDVVSSKLKHFSTDQDKKKYVEDSFSFICSDQRDSNGLEKYSQSAHPNFLESANYIFINNSKIRNLYGCGDLMENYNCSILSK